MSQDAPPWTAPRREDYVVVEGSHGARRDFRITAGLREGWDAEGRVYDVSEAVRTARAWMSCLRSSISDERASLAELAMTKAARPLSLSEE